MAAILFGCSKGTPPTAPAPVSLDEFVNVYTNAHKDNDTNTLLSLCYNLDQSEQKEVFSFLATLGAGEMDITFIKVIEKGEPLPDGFEPLEQSEDYEPNLPFNHYLCVKMSRGSTSGKLHWPLSEHNGQWYLPALKKKE